MLHHPIFLKENPCCTWITRFPLVQATTVKSYFWKPIHMADYNTYTQQLSRVFFFLQKSVIWYLRLEKLWYLESCFSWENLVGGEIHLFQIEKYVNNGGYYAYFRGNLDFLNGKSYFLLPCILETAIFKSNNLNVMLENVSEHDVQQDLHNISQQMYNL